MADRKCTCIKHQPTPGGGRIDTPCERVATHRLKDPDGVAYLCGRHARALRDMYEPGQLRKMRAAPAPGDAREEKT